MSADGLSEIAFESSRRCPSGDDTCDCVRDSEVTWDEPQGEAAWWTLYLSIGQPTKQTFRQALRRLLP